MDELRNILSIKIKNIRKEHKLTQEAFSEKIGIEIPTLSNIETGKNTPSLQTIIKIMELFKIAPSDFFSFVQWQEEVESPLDIEINEHVKLLPEELKAHLLEILKKIR